jgi:AraC family transcriptional regulator of adaptative response/methylated-DNA-[protein]-cysteine methyltransferase
VADLCRFVDACHDPPTVNDLATRTGWSPSHLHRVFRSVVGVSPKAYITARRAERLRAELPSSGTVTQALYGAGFGSSGRFYDAAPGALGMAPSAYRRGAPGEVIRWGVSDCSLGKVLVAATTLGICAVLLGDEVSSLYSDLHARFPKARIVEGDTDLDAWLSQVVAFIDDSAPTLPLPLDVRGSAFQMRVWEVLRKIPLGSTQTYADIARELGDPNSVRAVAGACAQNPVAVAIPCHRVVRSDGALSGYRWGVERKKELLQREATRRPKGD